MAAVFKMRDINTANNSVVFKCWGEIRQLIAAKKNSLKLFYD
jgi:hypothetical protein